MEPMVFESAEPVIVPVQIGDKHFELQEADEGTAVMYRQMMMKGVRGDGDGKNLQPGDGIVECEPFLVSRCLFELPGKRPVSLAQVKSLPSRIAKALYVRAKEISNLGDRAKDPKVSPSDTTDTSS